MANFMESIKIYLIKWYKKNKTKLGIYFLAIAITWFNLYLTQHSEIAYRMPNKFSAMILFAICLLLIINIFAIVNYYSKKSLNSLIIFLVLLLITILLLFNFTIKSNIDLSKMRKLDYSKMNEGEKTYFNNLKGGIVSLYATSIILSIAFIYQVVIAYLFKNGKK